MLIRRLTVALVLLVAGVVHAAEAPARPLFDGQTLFGWGSKDMSFWSVQDGAITGKSTAEHPAGSNQFLVWQLGEVDDFELTLKYRLSGEGGANSGIQFRSKVLDDGKVAGYQADIDMNGSWVGALYDELGRETLAQRGQKVTIDAKGQTKADNFASGDDLVKAVKEEDWNEYRITARGGSIELAINGKVMAVVEDKDEKDRDLSGVIALQLHSGPVTTVQFKDIMLRRLPLADGRKKVVFVAGKQSHAPGEHEHNAGCLLLAKCLGEGLGSKVQTTVYRGGWPKDPSAIDNADALVMYCDGGKGHMVASNLKQVDDKVQQGMGVGCIHYAVEIPPGQGGDAFKRWIGGHFETHWSVNPHWLAKFGVLPKHEVTQGIKPYEMQDEWYYHMRFVDGMKGVTPTLTALPPVESLKRGDGPHSGNPAVRKAVLEDKEPQHLMWLFEREDKSRGFGFTGGHFHKNWADDNQRTIVLNAIAWIAKIPVPSEGVPSKVTAEDMERNLDPKGKKK